MKKIMFVTDESVITGTAKTGMSDMVDGLAISMADKYDISVVAPNGNGIILKANEENISEICDGIKIVKFLKVTYYLVDIESFNDSVVKCYEIIKPHIFHNFSDITLLSLLPEKPEKSVLTIDYKGFIVGKLDELKNYNKITTTSVSYANQLLEDADIGDYLKFVDFIGITNGISEELFSPENGFLLSNKYDINNLFIKDNHKLANLKKFGIISQPAFAYFGRLSEEKGIDNILSSIPIILELGGKVIIMGKGDNLYETRLEELAKDSNDIIWFKNSPSAMQMIPLMASMDFYLSPSIEEACGLMPMIASKYGVIPIVTKVGGLQDNFNETNSIICTPENLINTIECAINLYNNKESFNELRKICMSRDFDWNTRNIGYIKIYES